MIVLAFDTAQTACSAALLQDGELLAGDEEVMARGQAERLLPMIEAVRRRAGIAWDAIDRVCTTTGPGTFAGVRIAVAAARAFALARDIECVGLTTLEALAAAAEPGRPCLALVDVRRGELAVQRFDGHGRPEAPWFLATPADVARADPGDRQLLGSGAPAVQALLPAEARVSDPDTPPHPQAARFGRLAHLRAPVQASTLAPLYARAPDARLPDAPSS